MSDMVLSLKVDLSDLDKALKEIEGKLKGVKSSGKTDIKLNADTKEFDQSLRKSYQNARRTVRGIAGFFFEVGFAITGAKQVLSALSGTFNTLVEPASKIEQLRLRLENLYQDTEKANQAFKTFVKTAKTTPYSLTSIVEAGAGLKAFGVEAETNIKLVADLAAYMGEEVPVAASAMGRAFAGGVGAADVLRERGILALISSFTGIEDLSKLTLPEFRKAMLDTFKDPSAGVAGATTKMVQSYAGAISNMKDAWELFRAELGQELTPALASVARGVGGLINSLSKTNFEKVREDTNKSIGRFSVLTQTLRDLEDVTNGTDVEKNIFRRTIQALNDEFGDYVGTLDTAITRYDSLSYSVDKARREMVADSAQRIKRAKVEDWTTEVAENIYKAQEYRNQISALKIEQEELQDRYYNIALENFNRERALTANQAKSDKELWDEVNSQMAKTALGKELKDSDALYSGLIKSKEDSINNLEQTNESLNEKILAEEKTFMDLFVDQGKESADNRKAFYDKLKEIDDRYSLSEKQALLKSVEDAKAEYDAIKDFDQQEIKLAKYEKFKKAQKEYNDFVAQEEKRAQSKAREDAKKLQRIEERYLSDSIKDRLERKLKSLEIERDRYLEEAQELGASKETLKNIELGYQNDVKIAIEENLQDIARQERVAYQEKLTRLKNEKDLGMEVYDELMATLDANVEHAKIKYGEDSAEYVQALADKKKATQEWVNDFIEKTKEAFENDYSDGFYTGDLALLEREEAYLQHLERIAEMEEEGSEKRVAIEKASTDQRKKYHETLKNYIESGVKNSIGQGQALMNIYQGQSRKMFNMTKEMAMANALINVGLAIQRAFADYKFPFNIAVAAVQGTLAKAEYDKIKATKYAPKAEKGGLTGLLAGPSHAGGGIMINAEGEEYITRKKRVKELGVPFFDFINNAPLSQVKKSLTPNIPMSSSPSSAPKSSYATGGLVRSDNSIDMLIKEMQLMREEFRNNKPVVHNHISANDVIKGADPEVVNRSNEQGAFIRNRSRY